MAQVKKASARTSARPSAKKSGSSRRTRVAQKTSAAKAGTKPSRGLAAKPKKAKAAAPEPIVPRKWYQRTPKAERPVHPKLPNVWQLSKGACRLLLRDWRLIVGIAAVFGVLNILLVRGLNGGSNVGELRAQFDQIYKGGWGHLASGLSVFALLLSSSRSGTASDAAGVYQTFLLLITSLALIWSYRQLMLPGIAKLRVRDAFYKGEYPLIPVLLLLLLIAVQLLPMLIGGLLFTLVITNGIALGGIEILFCFLLFIATIAWSLLLITPSIFALYIASLPDMAPLQAWRSAKRLVRFRRGMALRKVLFLPVLLLVPLCILILPIIFIVPVLAQWIFFGLSMFLLPLAHAYLYTVYRELLHE